MKRIKYNTEKYSFQKEIENIFDCKNLLLLHNNLPSSINYTELHKFGEDNKTWFHKTFYSAVNKPNSFFQELYEKFLREEVHQWFRFKKILFQKTPTFRVHTPNNIAVGGWHCDREYNHSPHEANIYLPLTIAHDTSTIWAESQDGFKDFKPINTDYGEYFIWDGANLTHGNKANITGHSRVSIDFRILPYQFYNPDNVLATVSANKKFVIGDYFSVMEEKG